MQLTRLAAAIVLATCGLAFAQTPTTQPTTRPNGAELMRTARDRERWMHEVKSLDIEWEGRWTRSPESIAYSRAALKKQFPTTEPSTAQSTELWPELVTRQRIAFDNRRMFTQREDVGDQFDRQIWDGRLFSVRSIHWNFQQDNGFLSPKFAPYFELSYHDIRFFKTMNHPFWWIPAEKESDLGTAIRAPDDPAEEFVVTGRADFRGVDCWVLDQTGYNEHRYYIGVADGLPRGFAWVEPLPEEDPRAVASAVRVAAERGKSVASVAEFEAWRQSLPKDQGDAAWFAFRFDRDRQSPDSDVKWSDDWREVVPGGWLPMSEGYRVFERHPDTKQTFELLTRERRVTRFRVNAPLDDIEFAQTFPDGVEMFDQTRDPPLSYTQKADRTPAEWDELVAKAKAERDSETRRLAAMDKWTGKSPIPFGDRRWLNVPNGSAAPTWESLKGKVVLLDFSAEWCGPCANDWPVLARLHDEADKTGIAVVALHPPGSSEEKLKKMIDDYKLAYPICIDTDAKPDAPGMGELFGAYGVSAIPTVFVIDRDGKVAGHGFLGEMLPLARSLAAEK